MPDFDSGLPFGTTGGSAFNAQRWASLDETRGLADHEMALIRAAREANALLNSVDGAVAVPSVTAATVSATTSVTAPAETLTAGAAAAAVALRFGADATEGLEIKVIDEAVATGSAAASFDLTENVPSGAVILSVQANLQTAITAATAVKVGVGVAADPDKYGLTTGLTQNLKIDTISDWAVLASAEDVKVFACDTNGAAAGTIGGTGESVRVRIVYATTNSLADA